LAVPYILAARWAGIDVTYVESATRLLGPSVTGRIAERLPGVELFRQGLWNRRGWQYFGSIFDGYTAEDGPSATAHSALVTIGSEQFPFARALESARDSTAGLTLSWQTGTTPTDDLGLQGDVRAWWPGDELAARAGAVDAVITHAGVGSILMVLRSGSCPVVIPRLQRLGEHIDDHQMELSSMLESRNLVVVARPGDDLVECIRLATSRRITRAQQVASDSP
jgi:UDP-N-acetylglucosamine transferase subunit ALG13